ALPTILEANDLSLVPQDLGSGSAHFAKELEPASRIDLDRVYRARDLLNLLRARTFTGHPGCFFEHEGQTYEISIKIGEKKHGR
ncbi:MAG: hypothetical protein WAO78_00710, partial [Roseovarius sp.]